MLGVIAAVHSTPGESGGSRVEANELTLERMILPPAPGYPRARRQEISQGSRAARLEPLAASFASSRWTSAVAHIDAMFATVKDRPADPRYACSGGSSRCSWSGL
jgi:hypothetical protein